MWQGYSSLQDRGPNIKGGMDHGPDRSYHGPNQDRTGVGPIPVFMVFWLFFSNCNLTSNWLQIIPNIKQVMCAELSGWANRERVEIERPEMPRQQPQSRREPSPRARDEEVENWSRAGKPQRVREINTERLSRERSKEAERERLRVEEAGRQAAEAGDRWEREAKKRFGEWERQRAERETENRGPWGAVSLKTEAGQSHAVCASAPV